MKLPRHLAIALRLGAVLLALVVSIAVLRSERPLVGALTQRVESAPDVSYVLLDGSRAQLSALRGRVVLINFWATSCSSCIKEMPLLAALHRQFQSRGLDTLAVAMHYDPPLQVVNFAQSRQLPFGVVIDNQGELARQLGPVELTPTTLVLNQRGEIVKRIVGPLHGPALEHLIEQLLAPPA